MCMSTAGASSRPTSGRAPAAAAPGTPTATTTQDQFKKRNPSPLRSVGPLVAEALLEVPAAREVALIEDPGVAALGIRQDFPGVVVRIPEEKAIGAVALGGLGNVVQAPLRRLLGAQAPRLVDLLVGV